VNKDEEESYLSSHCSPSNGASKAIHPKTSDRHHTGKPRKGSLQYNTRKIIKGRRSAGIRESSLIILDIMYNQMDGDITQELSGVYPHLEFIGLTSNKLRGQLPTSWGSSNNLLKL